MATQVQFRGGSSTEHNSFTGAAREVTVDTTKNTVVIHDGSTAGGHPLAKENNPTFTGNVGVGVSPSTKLHVSGSGTQTIRLENTSASGNAILDLKLPSHTFNVGVNSTSNYFADTGDNPYVWYHNSGERMRIDSAGNVGVGNSSPGYKLSVLTAGTTDTLLHLATTGGASANGDATNSVRFTGGTNARWANAKYEAFTHIFNANGTEKMRIDSSGNVGIGTAAADANLHIKGGFPTVHIQRDHTVNYSRLLLDNTANDGGAIDGIGDGVGGLRFLTSDAGTIVERLRIYSSGNIKLNGDSPFLYLSDNDNNWIRGSSQLSQIRFGTNNSEKMRIESSGNVLVGKTSSTGLTAGCELRPAGLGVFTRASANPLQVRRLTDDGDLVEFYQDSGLIGSIGVQGSSLTVGMAGVERLRIDSSGNVGIGTSSPVQKLHLNSTSVDVRLALTNSVSGSTNSDGCQFQYNNNDLYINNNESGFIQLLTGATPRMTIDGSGRVLIAKTASNFANAGIELRENGEVVATRSGGDVITTRRLVSEGTHFSLRNISGTSVGTIVTTSSSTAYNTSSDYRLKENVVDIADGITRVKQLSPKRFNFIEDSDKTVDGFIAHEAQTVVPEAVTGEKDGEEMQGIDQSKLVPLLTAALQEAIAKIETLETKVAALESA